MKPMFNAIARARIRAYAPLQQVERWDNPVIQAAWVRHGMSIYAAGRP